MDFIPKTRSSYSWPKELTVNIASQLKLPITENKECRYLVIDFGTSQSPKSTRQRDSL
ncbi:MAG: hypothetical protein KZQ65_09420 [Candidatus Thiodiazotropha sp. (ex Gloverina cf. vestifex)]|nr:hypothetical protein [Candidatus Thiodiazotropha sp. (ex Gloverina cf. vestifex)]